ncbi:MAG: ribosome maturation factor RimM [Streptococcaceae bacterium]|jgi:16S rRNA processing protein RimM|nr:ribosome maturation factor RimM [Streptococcaceae bacterium]
MSDYLRVAEIVNTVGLKGELRLKSFTDFPEERFANGAELSLFDKDQFIQTLTIHSARENKGSWQVTFGGLFDINLVEKFKGMTLKIATDKLSDLPQGEFYYHDIIGCVVFEDDTKIGTITEILSPGANDVWVIKRDQQKDLLIPYIPSVVLNVNPVEKRVEVEIPEGLD